MRERGRVTMPELGKARHYPKDMRAWEEGNLPEGEFCNASEDVEWLEDNHLRDVDYPDFESFVLYGDADAPDIIELYGDANPSEGDVPVRVFTYDELYGE